MDDNDIRMAEQRGEILGKLDGLQKSIDALKVSISSMENAIWPKIDEYGRSIDVLKSQVGWMLTLIIAPTIISFVYALFRVIERTK